ncbi:hypothetical protein GUJ93_ZPchr0014g47061 [Zizania palustris]|uniref:Uncharacterized protein n=1 Tax=Zizania palustris TaxID=103762 RepID=A0A8J5SY73_ZIZPA|nr:hypothetical protein GUJ93_ZPchr0014g47061 [Zizania palustris]
MILDASRARAEEEKAFLSILLEQSRLRAEGGPSPSRCTPTTTTTTLHPKTVKVCLQVRAELAGRGRSRHSTPSPRTTGVTVSQTHSIRAATVKACMLKDTTLPDSGVIQATTRLDADEYC